MILTWTKIIQEVGNKNIIIDPSCLDQVNPNSYNYRIWDKIKKYIEGDSLCFVEESILETGYTLIPNQMYLASTYEFIWSEKYMISLIWRSSIGRLWLFLQLSANVWHIWTGHKRTLELVSTKPIVIYPYMIIGQVSFWDSVGSVNKYDGVYKKYNVPQESLFTI